MITVLGERVNDPRLTSEQVARWHDLWQRRGWSAARATPVMVRGACRKRLERILEGREFRVYNLLPPDNRTGTWDEDLAYRVADEAQEALRRAGEPVVVLACGRRVASAFLKEDVEFGERYVFGEGMLALAVPHPSGLNRWWNRPGAEALVRSWLSSG